MKLDLRSWIEEARSLGELKELSGASTELEIGTIVDILMEKSGNPALLFDGIPGHQPGYRVLGNILTSPARVAISGGHNPKLSNIDLVRKWRDINNAGAQIPYECVAT